MVKELLSQAEIDALLANVQAQTPRQDRANSVAARSFDLASRRQLKKRQLPGLEQINKRFAEYFRESVSDVLGQGVDVAAIDLQFQAYSEYLHSLYVPTSLNIMRLHPLKGAAMLVFDARLVFRLVDMFFGGSGSQGHADGRDFSKVERRVITRLIERAHQDYDRAWRLTSTIKSEALSMEVNPAMAGIAGQAETVVVCRFQIELDSGGGGEFDIALPLTMLEPAMDLLSKNASSEQLSSNTHWQATLGLSLLDTKVSTRCTLAEPMMTLGQVANLQVGDVIPISNRQPSVLKASGVTMARGQLGVVDGYLTLKIIDE
jgi:flagellar motor switch protein FliM